MIRAFRFFKNAGVVLFDAWCWIANALFHLGTMACVVVSIVLIANLKTVSLQDAKSLWIATVALLGAIVLKRHFGQGVVRLNAKQLGNWKNMEKEQ
jgi:hypothetical protein